MKKQGQQRETCQSQKTTTGKRWKEKLSRTVENSVFKQDAKAENHSSGKRMQSRKHRRNIKNQTST